MVLKWDNAALKGATRSNYNQLYKKQSVIKIHRALSAFEFSNKSA